MSTDYHIIHVRSEEAVSRALARIDIPSYYPLRLKFDGRRIPAFRGYDFIPIPEQEIRGCNGFLRSPSGNPITRHGSVVDDSVRLLGSTMKYPRPSRKSPVAIKLPGRQLNGVVDSVGNSGRIISAFRHRYYCNRHRIVGLHDQAL